jgi:hypothetical protein
MLQYGQRIIQSIEVNVCGTQQIMKLWMIGKGRPKRFVFRRGALDIARLLQCDRFLKCCVQFGGSFVICLQWTTAYRNRGKRLVVYARLTGDAQDFLDACFPLPGLDEAIFEQIAEPIFAGNRLKIVQRTLV